MLDKRKREEITFSFRFIRFVHRLAKDPQLSDDDGDRQGDPAPDGLLEGDGETARRCPGDRG